LLRETQFQIRSEDKIFSEKSGVNSLQFPDFISHSASWSFDGTDKGRIETWVIGELEIRQNIFDLWKWGLKAKFGILKDMHTSMRSKNLWPPRILHGIPSF